MAEAKPKGEPVFLKIPTTGETITLPGVTSLSSNDELKAAADAWIAKNYKGPLLAAPVVARTPAEGETQAATPTEEISLIANRQPELKAYVPDTYAGSILDAIASGVETVSNLLPGMTERESALYSSDVRRNIETLLGLEGTERSFRDIAAGRGTGSDYLVAGLTALPLAPLAARPIAAGVRRVAPETSAAIGRFATGPAAVADEIAAAVPETALTPEMAAVAAPVAPAPVVPSKRPKAQAVELPEAPVAAAAIPEAAVAPTPVRAEPQAVLEQAAASIEMPPIATPERAGNLNLAKFDKPADVKTFLDDVAKANNNFVEARRGVMPISEINKKAEEIDLQSILGRKVGMALNAEQLQAARSVLNQTADDVFTKVKDWSVSGADPTKADEALDLIATHMAFQENLAGATAEAGRALRILREQPSSGRSLALRQLMEERARGVPAEDILQKISTLETPEQVASFVGKISKPNFRDKIEEYYINALLSGPQTQSINIASNALTTLSAPVEKAIEAGIGAVLRTPDRVTFREVGARIAGMGQGAVDGLRLAKQAFVTGEAPSAVTALETRRNAISGLKGEIVRLPSRFLTTQDEYFKAIHTRGELAAQAYKKALDLSQGNKEKFSELYNEFLNNPTEAMTKAARREADYRTFQAELGKPGKFVQRATNEFFLARYILPFVKTPFNLIKYASERSPLPFISDRWRNEIKAGGRQRNEALAKLTLGSSIAGTIATQALEGRVTGSGPSDPEERAALMATGWQPYSFKINDTYYPYGRLDPFGTPIGVVADLVTMKDYMTDEEYEKAAALIPFSVATNLAEKTYLQGATNLFEALFSRDTSPQRIENYFRNAAAGLIPNVARQTANALDPQLREADSIIKEAQNRVPIIRGEGFSLLGKDFAFDAVPERIDVWGDTISRTGFTPMPAEQPANDRLAGFVRNLVAPVKTSTVTTDPVKKEVARLQLGLERPDKKVSLAVDVGQEKPVKFEIELTDRERRQFTFASGILAKALVEQDIKSPEWKDLTEDERKEKIRDRMTFARKAFRQTIGTNALKRYISENNDLPKIKP
jgi:hypothetical protein